MINQLGVKWERERDGNFFFIPEVHKLTTVKGEVPNRVAFYRENNFISIMSGNYAMVENNILDDIIRETYGFQLTNKSSAYGNKKFQLAYDLDVDPIEVKGDKSEIKPMIFVKNSYDGTTNIEISLGFFRIICLNGMVAPYATFSIKSKHSGEALRDVIRVKLIEHIEKVRSLIPKANTLFNEMAGTENITIDDKMLKSYSPSLMILYLTAITNHYGLRIGENFGDIAKFVKDATGTNRKIEHLYNAVDKANNLRYYETCRNKWELWQMLIHISQSYLRQHRRITESEKSFKLING